MERELPEGWVETTVGEVLSLEYGKSLPAKSREGDSYPVMGSNGEVGRNSDYLIEGPGIVVGRKGSYGEVNWVVDNFFPIDTTYYVQITQAIDLRFAYNLLKSCDFKSLNRSTAIPGLNRNDAYQLNFPLPPLAEQKRIVAKLDDAFQHLDILKARLERIPELLKNFRQSVLTQAVTGKLTDDWREQSSDIETAQLLITRISKEREIRYTDAVRKAKEHGARKPSMYDNLEVILNDNFELFDLPDTWEWVDFRYTMAEDKPFCYGVVQPGLDDFDGNFLIRAGDLENGSVSASSLRTISNKVDEEYSRSKVEGGEILITLVGANVGDVAVVPDSCSGYNIARALAKAPITDFNGQYIYTWLSSSTGKYWMKSQAREVARPTLNLEQLRTIPVPLPPLEEQKEIVKRVEALFAKADAIEGYYATLKEKIDKLPQAILAKAFRGELVPQNPNDEPATLLLEKIKAAKAGAVKKGKGKKAKGSKQGELVL